MQSNFIFRSIQVIILTSILWATSALSQAVLGGANIPTQPNRPPTQSIGNESNWYIDWTSGHIFGPKTSGDWPQTPVASFAPVPISGFVPNNVAVGAASNGLTDSGNQLIKVGHDIRDPTNTDDSTQGYIIGSMWINTASTTIWVAKVVTANSAVWVKAIASLPFGATTIGWTFNPTSLGAVNYYTAPATTGTNQNTESLTSIAGTFSRLHIKVATPPGVGHQYIFTVYVGAPTAMIATSITCTIADTATTCGSSPIQTATIAEAQAYAVFCDLVGGTALAAQSSASLMLSY